MITETDTPEELAQQLDALDAMGTRCVGVNFIVPFLEPKSVEVAAQHCRFVEFFFGDPDAELVAQVHQGTALACWQVGSVDEALKAEDAGCDLIVAQSIEAGGHVRGIMPLFPLLDAVLSRVQVPVLAAGGVSTGRALAAMLAAGAAGVRVGTRFASCQESLAHDEYKNAIVRSDGSDTTYTEAFSVGWPAPHRVLQSCIDAASNFDGDIVGADASGREIKKFSPSCPKIGTTGHLDAMALWCSESAGAVTSILPAGKIVEELATEAARLGAAYCRAGVIA
jgi:nitronate monooxygenase